MCRTAIKQFPWTPTSSKPTSVKQHPTLQWANTKNPSTPVKRLTPADQIPPNTGSHAREIEQQLQRSTSALYSANAGASESEILERAQRDPEVLAILQDPIMQQILGQMKEDPGAVQDHLKNPMIREKIQKLVNAGIIRMGSR